MSEKERGLGSHDALPIQLQLRVLRTQLEIIESDLCRLDELKSELMEEIDRCQVLLALTKKKNILRRVK
ncbi:MAG: hypothetical protein VYA53_01350 [Acidobacteriota bacterium]|nr:hypothetical protein [Acidobacteriota bacterium]